MKENNTSKQRMKSIRNWKSHMIFEQYRILYRSLGKAWNTIVGFLSNAFHYPNVCVRYLPCQESRSEVISYFNREKLIPATEKIEIKKGDSEGKSLFFAMNFSFFFWKKKDENVWHRGNEMNFSRSTCLEPLLNYFFLKRWPIKI